MSQLINQGMNPASPAEAPMKRKRGRPRKDESQTQAVDRSSPAIARPPLRHLVPGIQGEGSGAAKPTANIASKGKDNMQVDVDLSADDEYNNDEMVGQVVTGVLECAFDAGYFLRVRVGNSNIYMRGVVFKEGCVVPVTPENDIAPNAKMYNRREIPIPVSFTPRVHLTAGNSSSKPIENNQNQQQQPIQSSPQNECHNVVLEVQPDQQAKVIPTSTEQQQEKLDVDKKLCADSEEHEDQTSEVPVVRDQNAEVKETAAVEGSQEERELEFTALVDKGDQDVAGEDNASNPSEEEKDVIEPTSDALEKGESPKRAGLDDSSEPVIKMWKTDEETVGYLNVQLPKDGAAADENSLQSIQAPTVLPVEPIVPPEFGVAVKEPVVSNAVDQEICGNPGFQISLDNADHDGILSEPPCEVSPMETE